MKQMLNAKVLGVLISGVAAQGVAAHAAVLLNLAPASAIVNATTGTTTPAVGDPTAGLSMNVTFTPALADLTGTVHLMDIGGTTNGSGIYLSNGQLFFVSKQSSLAGNTPGVFQGTVMNGTSNAGDNELAVRHSLTLTAGTQYSVAAVMAFSSATCTGVTLAVLADGAIAPITENFAITDTTYAASNNWYGNRTASVAIPDASAGSRGGLSESLTPGIYGFNVVAALTGPVSQGLMWNATGTVIVPEPAAAGLALPAGLLLAARRRR